MQKIDQTLSICLQLIIIYLSIINIQHNFMQKTSILLVLLLLGSAAYFSTKSNKEEELNIFQNWKITHGVKYSNLQQNDYRFRIFINNLKKINEHNSNIDRSYDMGLNEFSSLTQNQLMQKLLSNPYPHSNFEVIFKKQNEKNKIEVADIDWTTKGAVGPIKNQGQCSVSLLFSIIGSLEGLSKVSTGTLKTFSQQQLLDCSGSFTSCSGGTIGGVVKYIQTHPICTEQEYPYRARFQTCQNTTSCSFRISSFKNVRTCQQLEAAIQIQPVSVGVDASNWFAYKSGIFSNCGKSINHMVLLVGVLGGNWKVKNSWGTSWGEQGYIRLAGGNTCGICSYGVYPIK